MLRTSSFSVDKCSSDRVPSINSSAEQTHASHALLAKIVAEKKAALWINHDLPTFDSLKRYPSYPGSASSGAPPSETGLAF
jgi:hypothetical protein